ncbi:hypothetical protein GQ44DRAFT_732673 [Phaeosphaeriaceae sp. PMI808]|nr:hypothetical protein GQ44DRAFT_732673 [Phaeosphaeriaceae sp. PMI808]
MSEIDESESSSQEATPSLPGDCNCQKLKSFLRPNLLLQLGNLAQVGAETRLSVEKSRHRDTEREYKGLLGEARKAFEDNTSRYEAQLASERRGYKTQSEKLNTDKNNLQEEIDKLNLELNTTRTDLQAARKKAGQAEKLAGERLQELNTTQTDLRAARNKAGQAEKLAGERLQELNTTQTDLQAARKEANDAKEKVTQLEKERDGHEEEKKKAGEKGAKDKLEQMIANVPESINDLMPGGGMFGNEYPRAEMGRTFLDKGHYIESDGKVKTR